MKTVKDNKMIGFVLFVFVWGVMNCFLIYYSSVKMFGYDQFTAQNEGIPQFFFFFKMNVEYNSDSVGFMSPSPLQNCSGSYNPS